MLVYNVTVGIDQQVESEWVEWMKAQHIPAMMNLGIFVDYKFYKVLSPQEDNAVSYCVQYTTPSIDKFNNYLENYAPRFIGEERKKFCNRHVAFRTLLQEV